MREAGAGALQRVKPSSSSAPSSTFPSDRVTHVESPFWPLESLVRLNRVECVFLAGTPLAKDLVLALAKLVKDLQLAERLADGVKRDVIAIRLDDAERIAVLKALVDPPPGFENVRATLLADQARSSLDRLALDNVA
jgi:hypothetical protein